MFCPWLATAQVPSPPAPNGYSTRGFGTPHISLSKQFLIHDSPVSARQFIPREILTNSTAVQLDPTLLTVSCERIKKGLLHELGAPDQWRGKIFINLHPARRLDETIIIASARYGKDWMYHLDLPDTLERSRLIKGVVAVLLLEIANRDSERCAEIPAWLEEGIALEVTRNSLGPLVVESWQRTVPGVNMTSVEYRDGQRIDPLSRSHDILQNQPPLSLDELSWPRPEQLDGPEAPAYQSSAQFFVNELLHLPEGRACLLNTVKGLAQHLNWQLTFLQAFRPQFGSQLELEKWWALELLAFTGRNLNQTWPSAESWSKIEEAIRPIVQVRTAADEMPMRTPVSLQTIINDWDFSRQTPFLQERIRQLRMLRFRVSRDLAGLVDDYRITLENYLVRRDQSGITPMGRAMSNPRLGGIARQTLKELNALDARREQLRPKPENRPEVVAN